MTSPGPPSTSPARCGPCRRTSAPRWRSAASRSRSGGRAPSWRTRRRRSSPEGGRLVASAGEGSLELPSSSPPAGGGWRRRRSCAAGGGLEIAAAGGEGWNGIAPERSVALRVLRRVDDGAYADRALAAEARRAHLDPRTRAQATRLAYGAVQRRRTLDWLIDGALDRPASLEPARDILRIGAYELAFSDSVPAQAAVDQAVRQARALRGPKARAAARAGVTTRSCGASPTRAALLAELDAGVPRPPCATRCRLDRGAPRRLAGRGRRRRGDGGGGRAGRVGAAAGTRCAARGEELEAELPPGRGRDPLVPDAYVLSAPFALEESRAWARGLAMGQSRASQLVSSSSIPGPARGCSTSAPPPAPRPPMAALAGGGAPAVELRPARARALRSSRTAWGPTSRWWRGTPARCRSRAATTRCWWIRPAPGSGSCRRPDARWRRREEALGPLTELSRAARAGARPRAPRRAGRLLDLHAHRRGERGGRRGRQRPARRPRRRLSRPRPPAAARGAAHAPPPARHGRLLHRPVRGRRGRPPAAGKVLPSLMSADPLRVGEQLDALAAGARAFHVDVDGRTFVPNLTLGADFARAVAGAHPRRQRPRRRAPDGLPPQGRDPAVLRGGGRDLGSRGADPTRTCSP